MASAPQQIAGIAKAATGIAGLDQVTNGGLPRGRPTLICGGAGSGKTLFAMEFLLQGVEQYGEAGAFISFEEPEGDLIANMRSLGYDLQGMIDGNRFVIDHVKIDRREIEEAGDYDLGGLFLRIGLAIDTVGAKRIVLDTIEALLTGFQNEAVLRAELRRLFHWLKERGVTAVITAEKGEGQLTRQGLEEYVSDCVILLDHRVSEQVSTRRLRIVKYRGTAHGTNEYPFLIDEGGISVLPITELGLTHAVSDERVSSGVERLDAMLGGGYYRGSTVLVSGTAGTGKSSLCSHLANATCGRGERCLYFSFEESPAQLVRNMRSMGLDLQRWIDAGLLRFRSARPTIFGLEMHLAIMHKMIEEFDANLVIVDPVSSFRTIASNADAHAMLLRLIDFLKGSVKTAFFTSLTSPGSGTLEETDVAISSIVDTWLLLRDIELGGERNRGLYILKSRGMAHSNQIREFLITGQGIALQDVYVGPEGVLTGSMRVAQEAREKVADLKRRRDAERMKRSSARKQKALRAQIEALQAELEAEEAELDVVRVEERDTLAQQTNQQQAMARSRKAERKTKLRGTDTSHDER
jgi:circadian clock protein KaiC